MPSFKTDVEFKRLLPSLDPREFKKLEASIKAEGCRVALDVWAEEEILIDGHNRYEICKALGKPFKVNYVSLPDRTSAKIWILENQNARRNLTVGQRSAMALTLEALYVEKSEKERGVLISFGKNIEADLPQGEKTKEERAPQSRDKAAKVYGVSGRSVSSAKTVKTRGVPELFDAVVQGAVKVDAAEITSRLPKPLQKAAVEKGPDAVRKASAVIKKLSHVEKQYPGTTEKAVTSLLASPEPKTPKEVIDKAKEDAELKAFIKRDAETQRRADDKVAEFRKRYGSGDVCIPPNQIEMWCSDCNWGFDIFLPTPNESKCPYCCGSNVSKREPDWYPGKK